MLVMIGATPEGRKELVGFTDGVRESAHDWRELLLDLKRRGLRHRTRAEVADGALGFWKARRGLAEGARAAMLGAQDRQRSEQASEEPAAESQAELQDIWMAETRTDALVAFDAFVETYGVKYDKAVACLVKDREALLAFYDFPAEHWKHLRTTNPIESTFATIRHRTVRAKGCLSNKTALAMIFKLAESARRS